MKRLTGRLSLRTRVTLAVTAVSAVALTLGAVIGLDRMEDALIEDARANAVTIVDDFVAGLGSGELDDGSGTPPIWTEVFYLDAEGDELTEAEFNELLDAELGTVMLSADDVGTLMVVDPVTGEAEPFDPADAVDVGEEAFRVDPGALEQLPSAADAVAVGRPVELGGTAITIGAANPLQPVTDSLNALTRVAWIAIPLLIAAMALASWWIVGRALRPVDSITSQVHRIRNENLHERVPEHPRRDEVGRLAETMNEMLERLDQANQTQRRFVSDASHELRSPITATLATLEVARSDPDGTDWGEVSDVVLDEQRRLAQLVDDLLMLARLEETGAVGSAADVDLEELALVEAARPHPVPVGVKVREPARVSGDARTLARALRNIVDNATRHASTRVDVTIRVDDGLARIDVADDGAGIASSDREHLFERFTRVDDARNRSHGGAGLGLAIAQRIATSHGGTVTCESDPGSGTVFSISLPCVGQADG